jgi:O-antigen/teichoic acid export membrane protein
MTDADREREPAFATLNFRQIAWRLSAHSSVYTIGLIAIRFGGLILIPLYWRFLDPADYGVLAAAAVVTNFLAVFLGLGISESITRFYHAWPAAERRERIGTLWMADWASSFAIGIPLALWGGPLVQIAAKQVAFEPYLQLAVVSATLASLSTGPITLLRVQEKSATYVAVAAASFVLRTALAIYLVVFIPRGPLGVLQADVLTGLIMLPVYALVMVRSARPAWHAPTVSEGIRYSLPLIPGILSESMMWMMDRFVLEKYVTLAALGLYAVGDSIGGIVRVVSAGFKTAWLPFVMRAAIERGDAAIVIGRAATFYVLATLCLGLGVALTSADVIAVVGVPKYFPVAAIVPVFVVPNALLCLVPVLLGGLGVARRTGYGSAAAAAQLVVGVAALLLLVPRWGIPGALAAITLATATRAALGFVFAQRFYPVAFEWRKIGVLIASAVATFVVGRSVPVAPSAAGFAVRGVMVLVYAGATAWFVLGGRRWWMGRRLGTGVA